MEIQEFLKKSCVLGVGPIRSGTTWLYSMLSQHPSIRMPSNIKELHFFSHYWSKGFEWYISFYDPFGDKKLWCDISPSYITSPQALMRMKRYLPNVKILIFLRNPYDRVVSMYKLYLMYGNSFLPLSEIVQKNKWFLEENILSSHIKNYLESFGKNKIFFVFFDEIKDNPRFLMQKLCRFLEIDFINFNYNLDDTKKMTGMMPRNRLLGVCATKMITFLRHKLQLHFLVNCIKYNKFLRKIFYKNIITISSEEKVKAFKYLSRFFDPEIDRLSEILQKDLSHWKYTRYAS